jgi:hypothetical protein
MEGIERLESERKKRQIKTTPQIQTCDSPGKTRAF